MRAYAYRSGHIGFAPEDGRIPDGALVIAHGPSKIIEPLVKGNARLAYYNETYLIPGCPEAEDDDAAFKAFMSFMERIRKAMLRRTEAEGK